MLHACRGSGYRRGDLKRSKIIDILGKKAAMALAEDAADDSMTPKRKASSVEEASLGPVSSVEET